MITLNFLFKYKWQVAITLFLIVVVSGFIYFFQEKKQIRENVIKAEVKLTESGFEKFYQKEDNEFCVEEIDKQIQEDIARDMLWTLELDKLDKKDYQKIEKIDCKNGKAGIKVK